MPVGMDPGGGYGSSGASSFGGSSNPGVMTSGALQMQPSGYATGRGLPMGAPSFPYHPGMGFAEYAPGYGGPSPYANPSGLTPGFGGPQPGSPVGNYQNGYGQNPFAGQQPYGVFGGYGGQAPYGFGQMMSPYGGGGMGFGAPMGGFHPFGGYGVYGMGGLPSFPPAGYPMGMGSNNQAPTVPQTQAPPLVPPQPPMSMGAPPWASSLNSGAVLPAFTAPGGVPLPSSSQWAGYSPDEQSAIQQIQAAVNGISPSAFSQMMQRSAPEWSTIGPAQFRSY